MMRKIEHWYESVIGRLTVVFIGSILGAVAYGRLYFQSRSDRYLISAIFWSCVAIAWLFCILRERKVRKDVEGKGPDGGNDPE